MSEYVVQRRIKHQKLRRKARRGQIFMRRLYKFVRFCFVIFIFYATYRLCATHYWYLPDNIYTNENTQHLEILGNKITSNAKIITQMQKVVLPKEPLYKIDPAEIAREIEQLPPVKRAYIRRYWIPSRLVVMVEEVTPAFTIAPSEEAPDIAAFGLTGELIPREYLPLSDSYNITKILSYGTKGDDYENWDVDRIKKLHNLAQLLNEYSGEKVEYIDLRNPHNVFVKLTSVKLKLGELDESLYERIKSIHHILPKVKDMAEQIKYVDLSWKDSKYLKME